MELRTPMIPIDVNVIVETTEETEKSKKQSCKERQKRKLLAEVTIV